MDYAGVIKQAWRITRQSRVLRRLGLISAAQLIVYSLVTGAMLLLLTALPQLTTSLSVAAQGATPGAAPLGGPDAELVARAGQALVEYLPLITGVLLVLFGIWVVLGVFDVAAQAGMIAETNGALDSRSSSLVERMRAGFGMWWRVAGLSAVAAMPTLLVLLVVGLMTTITFTIPLTQGRLPDGAAAISWQLALAPLQGIASLVSAVLAVVVQIALRSAVLDDIQWRAALRRGWALVKANLVQVGLTYLAVAVIAAAVSFAAWLVAGVLLSAGALMLLGISAAAPGAGSVVVGIAVLGGVALTTGGVVVYSLTIAWTSAVWTIVWRNLTAPNGGVLPQRPVGSTVSMGTE